jgi:hypothetical protein
LIQRNVQADSIIALSQRNKEFCNTIPPLKADIGWTRGHLLHAAVTDRIQPLPTGIDDNILAFDIAGLAQALPEGCQIARSPLSVLA